MGFFWKSKPCRIETQEQMRASFPDADLLLMSEELLEGKIEDAGLRRLLTVIGIPERFTDVVELYIDQFETIADVYQKYDNPPPEGSAHLYVVGFVGGPFLGVDGSTGATFYVNEASGAQPIATSLKQFFEVLAFVSMELEEYSDRRRRPSYAKFAEELGQRTLKERQRIDPTASVEAAQAWETLIGAILGSEELTDCFGEE